MKINKSRIFNSKVLKITREIETETLEDILGDALKSSKEFIK